MAQFQLMRHPEPKEVETVISFLVNAGLSRYSYPRALVSVVAGFDCSLSRQEVAWSHLPKPTQDFGVIHGDALLFDFMLVSFRVHGRAPRRMCLLWESR